MRRKKEDKLQNIAYNGEQLQLLPWTSIVNVAYEQKEFAKCSLVDMYRSKGQSGVYQKFFCIFLLGPISASISACHEILGLHLLSNFFTA